MVDALHEVHRVLAPGGTLVDARPDSRVLAYAEHQSGKRYQRYGVVGTGSEELVNDRASDRAIARVIRDGLFKSKRRGRFWHRVPFEDLAGLRQYLWNHLRFVRRAKWSVDRTTLSRHENDRFALRRPVRYEVFERLTK